MSIAFRLVRISRIRIVLGSFHLSCSVIRMNVIRPFDLTRNGPQRGTKETHDNAYKKIGRAHV